MSLIFERFPSIETAEVFVAEVKERFDLDGKVFRRNSRTPARVSPT
jgi:hypothetical protein